MNEKKHIIEIESCFYLTDDGKKVYDIALIREDFEEAINALEQLNQLNERKNLNARNN
jgi:hypothetical protein